MLVLSGSACARACASVNGASVRRRERTLQSPTPATMRGSKMIATASINTIDTGPDLRSRCLQTPGRGRTLWRTSPK
jgi:hypothetical protein